MADARNRLSLYFLLFLAIPTSAAAADTSDVLRQIKQIATEEAASCERLLSRAARIIEDAYQGKEWNVVESSLKAAKMPIAETGSDYPQYKCVLLPDAWIAGGGVKMNLCLELGVSRGRSQPTYAVPPDSTILRATVRLSAALSAPHEQVRKAQWFGAGTVIQEALDSWPITETLNDFPILAGIDLSFGEVGDGDRDNRLQGYRLGLEFVNQKGNRAKRRRLDCWAALANQPGRGRGPVTGWLSRDIALPGAAVFLPDDLRSLLLEKEASYQRILWKATHLVQNATLGRDWAVVSQELGDTLKQTSNRNWQYGTAFEYLVGEKACITEGGQAMDLVVVLDTYRQVAKTAPTRQIIRGAYAALRADVGKTYAEVVGKSLFGKDTAVHQTLLDEKARRAAQSFPILNKVEVSYEVIGNRWIPENSWGFFVRPEFIPSVGDDSEGTRPSFSVRSNLDPLQRERSSVLVRDFVANDTLDLPVSSHGGSSWRNASSKGAIGTIFLTKKGEPRWRKTGDEGPKPLVVFGVGDLAALPADTRAIKIENNEIYDDDLPALARLTDLEVLHLGASPGITDRGLQHLAGLKQLKSLTLSGEVLSGTGLAHLRDLPLRELVVYSSQRLTDQGIAAIAELKQLTRLDLAWAKALSDDQVAELTKLPALRELSVWGSGQLTDAGLQHISTLPHLESLTFSHARQITSNGISRLAALTKLQELKMGYMPLSDEAMAPVSRIKSLEYVEMHGLDITGQGLQTLAGLTQLKRLYIHGADKLTREDVDKLKTKLKGEFVLD